MSKVFLIDTNKHPLNPVHPGRARLLLKQGKAAVWRRFPFTLILKEAAQTPQIEPLRIKLDPSSKTTGLALVNDARGEVVFAAEITHRGQAITKRLADRRASRRSRRKRKTRYRKPKFENRRRRAGWLPPSLESRIANILTWVVRLRRLCPITAISMELVKFDLQQMQNPEISGAMYQQGELAGFEMREYLLSKWQRTCAYCGAQNVPLQIEHIQPRAKGGSNRTSNLTLACEPCNTAKGVQDIRVLLAKRPDLLGKILAQAKAPMRDAAAVNSSRWALLERLNLVRPPLPHSTGSLTKFNRTTRELPKTHWLDACCVGRSTPLVLQTEGILPLLITATGHGNRQMCGVNAFGFPIRHRSRQKRHYGYQTGDIVRAVVTTGKKQGRYEGRVLVRASGSFDLTTRHWRVQGISHRFCLPVHRQDGYQYERGWAIPPRVRDARHSGPFW